MNPIRLGRIVLFSLPYMLIVVGVLAASKADGAPSVAFEALGVAAVGALWAWRRGRRNGF
ncbi:MYXO-CTERM domain-containing protein [Streptomyces sp. Ag109_O5-1]|uniref:hypothetical protein n=1 Tax=Streptomyces sp. Ag109_O5-1 TaxID=1938851 RepID=UPI000F50F1EA|nr:hypothetical protein [Streptomyces sp. Ag109_O5-1]RPE39073.1 MYXO-CTERM domain-containing protein [Streptomyces sp. Ag109_O5-1]